MIICLPVDTAGQVGQGWGRADRVALARAEAGQITDWTEFDVRWGDLHDQGTHGSHHARVVRFLREHEVDTVLAEHMGQGMQNTLDKLGIRVLLGAAGAARDLVAAHAAELARPAS